MKHMHTFGCPVFPLQNALASGKQLPRWSPNARLGLNLGPSPMHARNVYLVLNLSTRCVSPQYQCCFDDFFKTTRHNGPDVSSTISWQLLAGLNRTEMIFSRCQRQRSTAFCILRHSLKPMFLQRKSLLLRHFTSSQRTATASLTEILKSQRMCNHLTNPGLLIEVRELQVPSLLSQLVLANVGGFAQCHKEWQNLLLKVSTIWHTSLLSRKPMKTSSTTRTFN
jgi:hypothetical protein